MDPNVSLGLFDRRLGGRRPYKIKDGQELVEALGGTKLWLRGEGQLEVWKHAYVGIMSNHFSSGLADTWPTCETLLSHILSVARIGLNNKRWFELWVGRECGLESMTRKYTRVAYERSKSFLSSDYRYTFDAALKLAHVTKRRANSMTPSTYF
jgi:hypothetical protein